MRLRQMVNISTLGFLLLTPTMLLADYSYQETTQLTGGSLLHMMKVVGTFSSQARNASAPITSTVYLKGNRLARVAPEQIEIIDLDKETITQIDPVKHTYTVMTFEQMREQLVKAEQQMRNQPAQAAPEPSNPSNNDVKMSFDVKVRDTGAEKQVSGLQAKEAILTMAMNATDQKTQQTGSMAITNDMWMVPAIPGYEQVRDFYVRMGEKLGRMMPGAGIDMSRMLAQNPGAAQALTDMGKEVQKLKGVPIMQIMRMGTTADGKPLPAASEAPLPPDNGPAMPSGSEIAKQSAASMLTSKLGGFGFGHKKKDAEQADNNTPPQSQPAAQPTSAILMETQVTTSNFSSDPVDPSHFEVPAGYRQVAAR